MNEWIGLVGLSFCGLRAAAAALLRKKERQAAKPIQWTVSFLAEHPQFEFVWFFFSLLWGVMGCGSSHSSAQRREQKEKPNEFNEGWRMRLWVKWMKWNEMNKFNVWNEMKNLNLWMTMEWNEWTPHQGRKPAAASQGSKQLNNHQTRVASWAQRLIGGWFASAERGLLALVVCFFGGYGLLRQPMLRKERRQATTAKPARQTNFPFHLTFLFILVQLFHSFNSISFWFNKSKEIESWRMSEMESNQWRQANLINEMRMKLIELLGGFIDGWNGTAHPFNCSAIVAAPSPLGLSHALLSSIKRRGPTQCVWLELRELRIL